MNDGSTHAERVAYIEQQIAELSARLFNDVWPKLEASLIDQGLDEYDIAPLRAQAVKSSIGVVCERLGLKAKP